MGGSRLFLLGQSVSLLGDGVAALAVPLLVLQLTGSPVLSALAAAPRVIGYLTAGLLAGSVVDRTYPWRVLIAADAMRIVIFLLLAAAAEMNGCSVAIVLGLAWVAGVAGVFFETALAVVVRDVWTGPRLLRANGFLETSGQLSLALGPATAGVLVAAAGQETALLANAGTFAVSLMTVWRTHRRLSGAELSSVATTVDAIRPAALAAKAFGPIGAEFRAGLRYVVTTPVVAAVTLLQAVGAVGLGAEALIPFFARERFGASAVVVGLVVAGGGVGGVLGAILAVAAGPRRSLIRMCIAGVLLLAGGLAQAGIAPDSLWLAVANAWLAGASMVVVVVVRTWRQQVVPRALLGRVTSTARSLVLAAAATGTVLAGFLTRLCGDNPRPVFVGAAILVAVSTALVWAVVLRPAARHLDAFDGSSRCASISS